jgi:Na+/H+ antiporter NhaD/arsenite permease-like protein
MAAAAFLSYKMTSKDIHHKNEFNFHPIREVAILFFAIFITMIPALSWLEHNAGALGIRTPGQFFWASGMLSGVLDNAPTYLNFLSAACGLFYHEQIGQPGFDAVQALLISHPDHIRAVSIGAVFFGAMTYIGNGPNFLVKSIAHHSKIKTPSFFGYITFYSLPILIPSFALIWLLFFRV